MTAATTLSVTSLHAGYPGAKVLSGVDLTLSPGGAPLGLFGPSGAGKTTLIRVLRGALKPSAGHVRFGGRDVSRLRGADRRRFRAAVRFVSQYAMTIADPRETVTSRLELAAKEARKGGRTHAVSPAEMLAMVGLGEGFLGRRMSTLSGGETQRVALATALATRPQVLVLDEPLTAVHPQLRRELSASLAQMIERLGIGALVASHDMELLQRLCPQVAFLGDGRILAQGPLPEVLSRTEHEGIRELVQSVPEAVQSFR